NGRAAPVSATARAPSSRNSPPSKAPTWSCPPPRRRRANCACAASCVPIVPKPPFSTASACVCPSACACTRLDPVVVPTSQPKSLKKLARPYKTAEVGLEDSRLQPGGDEHAELLALTDEVLAEGATADQRLAHRPPAQPRGDALDRAPCAGAVL